MSKAKRTAEEQLEGDAQRAWAYRQRHREKINEKARLRMRRRREELAKAPSAIRQEYTVRAAQYRRNYKERTAKTIMKPPKKVGTPRKVTAAAASTPAKTPAKTPARTRTRKAAPTDGGVAETAPSARITPVIRTPFTHTLRPGGIFIDPARPGWFQFAPRPPPSPQKIPGYRYADPASPTPRTLADIANAPSDNDDSDADHGSADDWDADDEDEELY
ncbi:hypothetical protein DFH06DRAFT_1317029 [Mycena polygramma]|nr:hypothetical protein DFH06DRAFT_1317029 [Mycena polygramma]